MRTQLMASGWRIATVWECALRKSGQVEATAGRLAAWLDSGADTLELGEREVMATAEITPGGTTSAEPDAKETVQE